MTDIEIAQACRMMSIEDVAAKLGLNKNDIDLYGNYKAKINFECMKRLIAKAQDANSRGKLILVTAITPTPAGEGKSTVSIGLADGLRKIGKTSVIALREPSLGPCFGVKGGACGGGMAQIVPMEDINLHFTGDIHAISAANNLIAAIVDNHIHHGNDLDIDPRTVTWKRCVDLNDRQLRNVVTGLGGPSNGSPREDHFCISVASEIMAIVCLSRTIGELKSRLGNIVIARTRGKEAVKFEAFGCVGAVAALLKDAIRPNIVQTLEGTPAFVHGGPFANIAHGCNSINATLCALASGDYVVTEAGFAADLGAEKFMDIKCRAFGLAPQAVVIVATVRALKMHGGVSKADLGKANPAALERGFANLATHIENVAKFGVSAIVAINRFTTDTAEELNRLERLCVLFGAKAVVTDGWGKGGDGAKELSLAVAAVCDSPVEQGAGFHTLYDDDLPLALKIETIAREIYRAGSVTFESSALKKLTMFQEQGYGNFPVCIAKTQNSISHDPKMLGAPHGYTFPVKDVQLYAGARFIVALAGDIVTMPGLPKRPAALDIDVDEDGKISGLF